MLALEKLTPRFLFRLTFVYTLALLIGSLWPARPPLHPSALKEFLHNALHVPAYAGLSLLLAQLSKAYKVRQGIFLRVFLAVVSFGILIEILQGFVPGRSPELIDVGSNALGAILMLTVLKLRGGI